MTDNDYDYELKAINVHSNILDTKWRVKLYHLNQSGNWDDMGIGHIYIKQEDDGIYLKMDSEINLREIFKLKLTDLMDFHRQRGTILTWKSGPNEEDDDSAISFQDKEGIREVWQFICSVKGVDPKEEIYEIEDDEDDILPEPILDNLCYIARDIRPDLPTNKIVRVLNHLMNNKGNYMKRLGLILENEEKSFEKEKRSVITGNTECSDLIYSENPSLYENLNYIFTIFRNIFFIADKECIEMMLSDELYLITFGAFEYDFDSQKLIRHRQFFKEISQFKNILNINDEYIISKINFNHRATYLRDTAIARFIEEHTLKNLNILLNYSNSEIVQFFLNNKNYLVQIIDMINDNNIDIKSNGIDFMMELIQSCKDLIQTRLFFYEVICELNIIESLEQTLLEVTHYTNYNQYINNLKYNDENRYINVKENTDNNKNASIKINCIEILLNILNIVPHILKAFIIGKDQKNKEHPLLSELCNILIHQENFGIKYEIEELFKSLLESELIEKKNEFYDVFYNKCLTSLVDFLNVKIIPEYKYEIISSKQVIIELICFCLKLQNNQRIKYWVIHNDLIPKILKLLEENSKILHLQVVKFFKALILLGDENIIKLIITNDYLNDIIKLYNNYSQRDNLIVSSIMELFEFLKRSNSKKIFSYIFEKHYEFIHEQSNKNIHTFNEIISKYEQGIDNFNGIKSCEDDKLPRFFNKELAAEEDEQYFNDIEEEKIYYTNEPDSLLKKKTNRDNDIEGLFRDMQEEEEELFKQLINKRKKSEDEYEI